MAAAAHFSTRIYGEIQGSPPFQNTDGTLSKFSLVTDWPSPQIVSLPTSGISFFTLPAGYQMGNGAYVYSVISVQPTGLNVHGKQYVATESVTSLATNAG